MQAEVDEIIAGVDDDRQVFRRQHLGEAERQLSPADAAAKRDDMAGHRNRSLSKGRRSSPTPTAAGSSGHCTTASPSTPPGTLEASMPALARTWPVRWRAMITPGVTRISSCASAAISSTTAASFSALAAASIAAAPGVTLDRATV